VSASNELPARDHTAVKRNAAPRRVLIEDITLREGQQAAEVAFSRAAELDVVRLLDRIGVADIQVGFAGRDNDLLREVADLGTRANLAMILVGFANEWQSMVDEVADLGVSELQVLFRSADPQLAAMGLTRDEVADAVTTRVAYAKDKIERVTLTPSFGTSADLTFLSQLFRIGVDAGADRVAVIDTLGISSPESFRALVEHTREIVGEGVGIDVHCHDDLGLAVANSIAGVLGGADRIDASINGYGERAGNCPLEEVGLALKLLYGIDAGIDLSKLVETSSSVAALARTTVPSMKAVVGRDAFSQKLDIHLQLAEHDSSLMEPYDPALVGNTRQLRLGVGTGPKGVLTKLAELGSSPVDTVVASAVAAAINDYARKTDAVVGDAEFRRLVAEAQTQTVTEA
jgi:isopropylmalate/homocitrate/citramalate synthase